ncbi:MAG: hypothetical protein VW438_02835 [Euryarchaeota archaeon]
MGESSTLNVFIGSTEWNLRCTIISYDLNADVDCANNQPGNDEPLEEDLQVV